MSVWLAIKSNRQLIRVSNRGYDHANSTWHKKPGGAVIDEFNGQSLTILGARK
ncbi:MAG: hypothetical protein Ct9H90mP26_1760 [Methanobacteriota archaeon]|nr:MAG: hypothetical protein Ct9H90mP26_1760 [Euryarchaeota archaeon]